MINVYKKGGAWGKGKGAYTVKSVNQIDVPSYREQGYSLNLEAALKVKDEVVKDGDNKGADSKSSPA